jgi:hypothetical protein
MFARLADLKDSPHRETIEAIRTGIATVEPEFRKKQLELFEFKEKHPDIATKTPEVLEVGSPMVALEEDIDRAKKDLKRCYGATVEPSAPRPKRATPGCTRMRELEKERDALLAQFTKDHPTVIAAQKAIEKQKGVCEREQDAADDGGGPRPGASPAECAASATARIKRFEERKFEFEKKNSKKPKLQREWAQLNIDTNAFELQMKALNESEARATKDRLLAANEFRDSFVLVDPPRIPELPSSPDRNQFLGFGMAMTLLVGMLFATAREALRQTFADARELEEQTGIQVLATLPDFEEGAS